MFGFDDDKVDRLMGLPVELRQRVYLFCGFPVAQEWYHACNDDVVSVTSASEICNVVESYVLIFTGHTNSNGSRRRKMRFDMLSALPIR